MNMLVVLVVLMQNVCSNSRPVKNKNAKKYSLFSSRRPGKTFLLTFLLNELNFSYAAKADLYELTMHLARHFWNTCRSSIKRRLERSLLFDSLNELIHHINTVAPKSIVGSRNEKETVIE